MFEGIKKLIRTVLVAGQAGTITGDPTAVRKTIEAAYPENAFAQILIGSIMAVVVGAIMLIIGIFTTSTVSNAIPDGDLTAAQNATLASANSNVSTAFTLLGVILIVGGAGGIIAVLLGFVGGGQNAPRV